ncbi:3'-5' exoribonuclease domain-containing protein [Massilia sp. LC238]|uniref:3'-5' exoribonuclease domain-containing protein n=1 Tax=Massilia sp. LC238 TaxID=1502852 RepID=UPI0009DD0316|nr:3'-5' exoribonuclease [Massilia sp. LC238]
MEQQLLFLDTEFTDFNDPKLISVGIAGLGGEEFYAEVEYSIEECSEFVRKTVLPLLTQERKHSLEELRLALLSWIEQVRSSGPILICFDSEYDRRMLEQIFETKMPPSTVLRCLGASHVNKLKMYEWHVKHKQAEHHALYDARALKHGFRGWVRNVR